MKDSTSSKKDWFQFRKGMDDFLLATKNFEKKSGNPKTKNIANNSQVAPHSVQKIGITTRP
jgi:hypothetical protein